MENISFKAIVLGEQGVGKSSLLYKYITHEFNDNLEPSIGVEYFKINLIKKIDNDINFNLKGHFWDISGNKKFIKITKNYLNNYDIAILVFSDILSLINLTYWIDIARINNTQKPAILVYNKFDTNNEISIETINKFMNDFHIFHFIQISTHLNYNIDNLFEYIKDLIYHNINENLNKNLSYKNTISQEESLNCLCSLL